MTLFEKAIQFAVEKHSGEYRKRENIPYILHPMEAAVIAGTLTSDEEVLAAAVLHDTVEDTDTTLQELEVLFGKRVAALVASETENKRPDLPPEASWKIRKEETLRYLKEAEDPGVRIMWLSDKVSNMRSFYRIWKISGNSMWENFHQKDPAVQAWYYRTLCTMLDDLKDSDAWKELYTLVETVFEGIG